MRDQIILWGVDAAIVVLVVEALILLWLRRKSGRGLPPATILLIAGSGLALILALRAGLHGQGLIVVGLLLSFGGILHAIDLTRRIRAALEGETPRKS